jgi:hypothetical protein
VCKRFRVFLFQSHVAGRFSQRAVGPSEGGRAAQQSLLSPRVGPSRLSPFIPRHAIFVISTVL